MPQPSSHTFSPFPVFFLSWGVFLVHACTHVCRRCLVFRSHLTFETPGTVTHQAPLSFSRQEYWSGLLFPSPGDIPNPGIEPTSPALADRFFTTKPSGKPRACTFPGPEHICIDMCAHLRASTWPHCSPSALPSKHVCQLSSVSSTLPTYRHAQLLISHVLGPYNCPENTVICALAFHYIQFSSVAQSCLTLCDPIDHSTPGFPVHHQLLELTQTHVH